MLSPSSTTTQRAVASSAAVSPGSRAESPHAAATITPSSTAAQPQNSAKQVLTSCRRRSQSADCVQKATSRLTVDIMPAPTSMKWAVIDQPKSHTPSSVAPTRSKISRGRMKPVIRYTP